MSKQEYRALVSAVGRVLRSEWDPLGIVDVLQAGDEYDDLARRLPAVMVCAPLHETIAQTLIAYERDELGLAANEARAHAITGRLLALI